MIKYGPKLSREELKAQAAAALASFKEKGGAIDKKEPVVATAFACANCGHAGIIGVRPGGRTKCPRCREPITVSG